MKKLLAILLTLALLTGICSAFADEEPIKLTLWTFQELHTQLYKDMLGIGSSEEKDLSEEESRGRDSQDQSVTEEQQERHGEESRKSTFRR